MCRNCWEQYGDFRPAGLLGGALVQAYYDKTFELAGKFGMVVLPSHTSPDDIDQLMELPQDPPGIVPFHFDASVQFFDTGPIIDATPEA